MLGLRLTWARASPVCKLTSLEPLPLLNLQGQVEGTDGKVDGLRVHPAHCAQEVEDPLAFRPHQAGEELGYPRQPLDGGHPLIVRVYF